jgi:hypothetical protein
MKRTKTLTVASLMAALCVVILSLGSLIESLDLSLAIFAGLVILILSAEYGDRVALTVFCVVSLLSFLLPQKSAGLFFLALSGWYPVAQKKIQMLKPFLCRIVKFSLFNFVLVLLMLLSFFVTGIPESKWVYGTLAVLGNLCFYCYDLLLDRILLWYWMKLRPHLRF